jgi:hypothetical protein
MNRTTHRTETNIQEKTQRNTEIQDVILKESMDKNVFETNSVEQLASCLEWDKFDSLTSPHTIWTSVSLAKNMKL